MIAHLDYVLDTSAVLALILGESDARPVVDVLERSRKGKASLGLPFVALMECEYQLLRRLEPGEVAASLFVIEQWPAAIVESNEAWRHEAARIKAKGRLSLADAWIAALATLCDAELIHKDPEFEGIVGLRSIRL